MKLLAYARLIEFRLDELTVYDGYERVFAAK